MKTIIKPTFKNVAVLPLEDASVKENKAAGIVMPDDVAVGSSKKGTILAVGPDCSLIEGSLVVYRGYGYEAITRDGSPVLVMDQENIVCVIVEEEAAA